MAYKIFKGAINSSLFASPEPPGKQMPNSFRQKLKRNPSPPSHEILPPKKSRTLGKKWGALVYVPTYIQRRGLICMRLILGLKCGRFPEGIDVNVAYLSGYLCVGGHDRY